MVCSCCNAGMETAEIRRLNLSRLIKAEGLSVVAAKVGKPDRQLNDMVAGRKSFGEKVARAIEKAYAPSRAPGWLDLPATGYEQQKNEKRDKGEVAAREPQDVGYSPWKAAAQTSEATRAAIDLLLLPVKQRSGMPAEVQAAITFIENVAEAEMARRKSAA